MEDSYEDKRQECQYPQESMRMQCMLKYEMQATLEKKINSMLWNQRTMQLSYAMIAYMKYANAPSKLQCEFLQYKVSVCVWYLKKSCSITLEEEWMYWKWEERALLLNKNGW